MDAVRSNTLFDEQNTQKINYIHCNKNNSKALHIFKYKYDSTFLKTVQVMLDLS